MESLLLHIVLCLILCVANAGADRKSLINEAMEEASTAAHVHAQAVDNGTPNTPEKLLSAFKHASQEAIHEGNARVKFEEGVKRAERKVLEAEQQQWNGKGGAKAKAEELAKELFHRPGTVLTDEEIAAVYEMSDCTRIVENNTPVCGAPQQWFFRSTNGVCNNLQNPLFGAARTPFRRLIPSQYEDGLSQVRGTFQSMGSSLLRANAFVPPNPSARIVSLSVVQDKPIVDDRYTHLLMQWGQFLDHDLDLAPAFKAQCSGCTNTDRCAPIHLPTGDSFLNTDSMPAVTCQPFVRSIPACNGPAAKGIKKREQINELNSFIDGSQIYGTSDEVLDALREPNSARLRTGPNIPANGGPSLPLDTNNLVECVDNKDCFLAGDVRVNEQMGLTVMHTIWMREHNRIADRLRKNNPQWDNDTVFKVARQIVGAEIQKITFEEYLPIIMGSSYSLISNYSGYNNATDPSIPNAFATAAFRFGHSQIQPFFDRLDENFQPVLEGPLSLVNSFFNPREYANSNGTDPILRGLLTRTARRVDEFLNDVLTNHLFQTNTTSGMDLASLNIQRGRDHGLPPYLTWKRWAQRVCGISSDLDNELTTIHLLQTYGTLDTVDLWVGGLAEKKVSGGIIGATFACIFAKTFEAIRNGDRFYYENRDPMTAGFTAQQRETMEQTSLSRVICNNADNIREIQPNAFRADQERVPCSTLRDIDLDEFTSTVCYLRIRVNGRMRVMNRNFTSVSIPNPFAPGGMTFRSTVPSGSRRTCLAFLCPNNTLNISLSVFSESTRQGMCRVRQNRRLPMNDLLQNSGEYVTDPANPLTVQDINRKSGLYDNMDSCIAGRRNALRFNCGGDQTAAQEEIIEEELDDELYMMDDDEVSMQEWMSIKSNIQNTGEYISLSDSMIPKDIQLSLQAKVKKQNAHSAKDGTDANSEVISLLEAAVNQLKGIVTQDDEAEEKKPPYAAAPDSQSEDGADMQVLYDKLAKVLDSGGGTQ